VTAKVIYEGNLRTTATHIHSGSTIETDAPLDNGGNGERFSPTDLVATALASCMCTVMGISARKRGVELGRIECEVEKIMAASPRRISEIKLNIVVKGPGVFSDHERSILERAALTCPVYESLHPDCAKTVLFIWPRADNAEANSAAQAALPRAITVK
jgi:uncharacterized OsmC-like protein